MSARTRSSRKNNPPQISAREQDVSEERLPPRTCVATAPPR